jgi:CRP-like cAMP-binding protein
MATSLFEQYLKGKISAKKVSYSANSTIISEKDIAKEMYFIESGQVKITRMVPEIAREITVATLGPNEFLGLVGLVMKKPRIADVVAVTDCVLWTLDEKSFREAIAKSPEFAHLVIEGLCRRLNNLNEKIRNSSIQMKEFTTHLEELSLLWHSFAPY